MRDYLRADGMAELTGIPGFVYSTDTRYYWALTEHIYRYNHHNSGNGTALSNGVHTINECEQTTTILDDSSCGLTNYYCSHRRGCFLGDDPVLLDAHLEC